MESFKSTTENSAISPAGKWLAEVHETRAAFPEQLSYVAGAAALVGTALFAAKFAGARQAATESVATFGREQSIAAKVFGNSAAEFKIATSVAHETGVPSTLAIKEASTLRAAVSSPERFHYVPDDALHSVSPARSTSGETREYIAGRLDEHGVWQPVRDVHDLPSNGRRQLADIVRGGLTPLLRRSVVDDFVQTVTPSLESMKPLSEASQDVVVERARTLLAGMNRFAENNNLPRFKLDVPTVPDQALVTGKMYFDSAEGALGLKTADLLRAPGTDGIEYFVGRAYHEVNHHAQIYDVFRYRADALHVPRNVQRAQELAPELREDLQIMLGQGSATVSPNYMSRLLEAWSRDTRPVTVEEKRRAAELARGFNHPPSPGMPYVEAELRINQNNGFLAQLQNGRSAADVIGSMRDAGRTPNLLPPSLHPLWTNADRGPIGTSASSARLQLEKALSAENSMLNAQRSQRYFDYASALPEVEAWLAQYKARIAATRFIHTPQTTPH